MDVGDQTVMICRRLLSFELYFAHLCNIFRVCENWIALFWGGIRRADCCLVSLCLFVFIVTKYTDEKVDT